MNDDSLFDIFGFCSVIFEQEFSKWGFPNFTADDCTIEDTRDVDFNLVKNRLAYIYMHGCNHITLLEKCVLDYFGQCSKEEISIFKGKTQVCSLSNGPGFDIVGFLNAFYKLKIKFNVLPSLKIINVYESWQDSFKWVISNGYLANQADKICSLNPLTLTFLKSDIYSTLSPEAERCIVDSEVLLMVNIFQSSKANAEVVKTTMQRIFALMHQGSCIFYIGSKNNATRILEVVSKNNSIDVLFGPSKVSPKKIKFNDPFIMKMGIKPKQSASSYCTILQKSIKCLNNSITTPKKKLRKKRKVTSNQSSLDASVSENFENADYEENTSVISSSNVSDAANESNKAFFNGICPSTLSVDNIKNVTDNNTLDTDVTEIKVAYSKNSTVCDQNEPKASMSISHENNETNFARKNSSIIDWPWPGLDQSFQNDLHDSKAFDHLVDLYSHNFAQNNHQQDLNTNICATSLEKCENHTSIDKACEEKEENLAEETKLKIAPQTFSTFSSSETSSGSVAEHNSDRKNNAFRSVAQRCQVLLASVEKLVENISVNLPNHESGIADKKCCYCQEVNSNSEPRSDCKHYLNSCCRNVHLHCNNVYSHCTSTHFCNKDEQLSCGDKIHFMNKKSGCCREVCCSNMQSCENFLPPCRKNQSCCNPQLHSSEIQSCSKKTKSPCRILPLCCKNTQATIKKYSSCCICLECCCKNNYKDDKQSNFEVACSEAGAKTCDNPIQTGCNREITNPKKSKTPYLIIPLEDDNIPRILNFLSNEF